MIFNLMTLTCLLNHAVQAQEGERPRATYEGRSVGGFEIDIVDPPKSIPTWEIVEIQLELAANGKISEAERAACRKMIRELGNEEYRHRQAAHEALLWQVKAAGGTIWVDWLENELNAVKDVETATRLRRVIVDVKAMPECPKQGTARLYCPDYPRDISMEIEKRSGEKWVRLLPLKGPPQYRGRYTPSGTKDLQHGEKLSVKMPIQLDLAPGRYRMRFGYVCIQETEPWYYVFRGRLVSDWFEVRVTRPSPALADPAPAR